MSRFRSWLWHLAGGDAPYERTLLASLLSVLGEHAFETHRRTADATRQAFFELSEQAQAGELDAVIPFVREQRRDEQQFVEGHLNDLRDLVWSLLGALSKVAQDEAQDDAALRQQVQQLTQQAQRPDALNIHDLRQALHSLARVIEQREQRHRQTLNQLQGQVHHLMRELAQARRESTTDPLTGLYNRRAFEDSLHHTVGLNRLFGYPATMMLLDIDHFKQINDTYGHATGDAALKWVAEQIVRVCKRKSDFAARYGGEEFAIILRETCLRDAQKIAQQLAEQVRKNPLALPDGELLRITVSIGVSELQPNESEEAWFRRTDALLYQAKQAGRDRVAA
ncbi:MAG: GGDEF domain-containing protein [Fimbriimonadales bacterium]|nr:GGDEF domain-containing protein [Fimbriimonadales bacterium]